jgi:dCMP deaminase
MIVTSNLVATYQSGPSKWDFRFLEMAKLVASWSKDPSTQTGAVVVRPDQTIASLSYNGFAKNMSDDELMYADRELKYSRIIHCEMNAILTARERLDGYTLYTHPFLTCDRCSVHVIQAGIKRVVAPVCPVHLVERWQHLFDKSRAYYMEAGVVVDEFEVST